MSKTGVIRGPRPVNQGTLSNCVQSERVEESGAKLRRGVSGANSMQARRVVLVLRRKPGGRVPEETMHAKVI